MIVRSIIAGLPTGPTTTTSPVRRYFCTVSLKHQTRVIVMFTVCYHIPRALPVVSAIPVARLFSTQPTSFDLSWPLDTRACGSTSTAHGTSEASRDAAGKINQWFGKVRKRNSTECTCSVIGSVQDLAPFNVRMTLDFKKQSDLARIVAALTSPSPSPSQKLGQPVAGKELTCASLTGYCAHCERLR